MAKKKATAKSKNVTPSAVLVRGGTQWREWLSDYATKKRTSKVGLIDLALAEMAERDGFRSPPPRRGKDR